MIIGHPLKKKGKKERGKNGQKSVTSFLENEQREKRERKFQLFFEKMRRKERRRRRMKKKRRRRFQILEFQVSKRHVDCSRFRDQLS